MSLDYEYLSTWSETPIINYKQSVVRVGDLANKMIQTKVVNKSNDFPLVQTLMLATTMADSVLRKAAYPLAEVSLVVNRKGNRLQKGTLFKYSNNKYGIVNYTVLVITIFEQCSFL